jgi:hypothetical protein
VIEVNGHDGLIHILTKVHSILQHVIYSHSLFRDIPNSMLYEDSYGNATATSTTSVAFPRRGTSSTSLPRAWKSDEGNLNHI